MSQETPAREFSVEIDLDALPYGGKTLQLLANAAERVAIAKRLGAVSIEQLEGEIRIEATSTTIIASGRVKAELVRQCVASLEEMTETVDETFETEFLRAESPGREVRPDDSWDAPEVHESRIFDAGEFMVQQLSLAMDPFPRKPEAPSLAEKYGRTAEDAPFSSLAEKLAKSERNQ